MALLPGININFLALTSTTAAMFKFLFFMLIIFGFSFFAIRFIMYRDRVYIVQRVGDSEAVKEDYGMQQSKNGKVCYKLLRERVNLPFSIPGKNYGINRSRGLWNKFFGKRSVVVLYQPTENLIVPMIPKQFKNEEEMRKHYGNL